MKASVSTPPKTCSDPHIASRFDEAVKLIGDFWTLRIIDVINTGELRFCEIERALPDGNPATLTNRLKRLEEAGVVQRCLETRDRQSVTYILTDKGKGITPTLRAIKRFTETHLT